MKIILFSNDEETVKKISQNKTLQSSDLVVQKITEPVITEPLKLKIALCSLIILDMGAKDPVKDEKLAQVFKDLSNFGIPILLLMDLAQTDILSIIKDANPVACDILIRDRFDEEFELRVRFLTSRQKRTYSENAITVQGLILDRDKYEVSINGRSIELAFKEYELLKILLENQNKVFSRNKLLSTVWGYDFYGGSRTVDVHMRRLRSKLESPYSDMLKTVRNAGYLFTSQNLS